jgi:hypothetical protein
LQNASSRHHQVLAQIANAPAHLRQGMYQQAMQQGLLPSMRHQQSSQHQPAGIGVSPDLSSLPPTQQQVVMQQLMNQFNPEQRMALQAYAPQQQLAILQQYYRQLVQQQQQQQQAAQQHAVQQTQLQTLLGNLPPNLRAQLAQLPQDQQRLAIIQLLRHHQAATEPTGMSGLAQPQGQQQMQQGGGATMVRHNPAPSLTPGGSPSDFLE